MIHFGTAGWRGVIGDEFTFRNVRLVVQAIADTIEPRGRVVVGHDTRFLSERFAVESARVFASSGFEVLRAARDTPSPMLSFAVDREQAVAGLTITASHCPPEYNGLKLYGPGGVPAARELTDRVEARARALADRFADRYGNPPEAPVDLDPTDAYLRALEGLVDLEAIAVSGIRVAIDPLFGTAHELLDRLLMEARCTCEVIHNFRDAYVSGYSPAFSNEALEPLRERVAESRCVVGLATDTDADRFAVIDTDGTIVDAHDAHALLLDYLCREDRCSGDVARSVATSHLLDRVAAVHGRAVHETAVGFRHLGPLLTDGTAELAFEESAGFGWSRHLPDKDGILACLLVAEMAARNGTPLAPQVARLHEKLGGSVHVRRDYPLDEHLREGLEPALLEPPDRLGEHAVRSVGTIDGFKLHFDDSWFLYRLSGTKPVLRCYAEAPTRARAEDLHEAGRRFLFDPSGAA